MRDLQTVRKQWAELGSNLNSLNHFWPTLKIFWNNQGRQMLYTLAEAAQAMNLEEEVIVAALESGQITGKEDLSSKWLIEDDEIHRFYLSVARDYCKRKCRRAPVTSNKTTPAPENAIPAERDDCGVQQQQSSCTETELAENGTNSGATAAAQENGVRIDIRDRIVVTEPRRAIGPIRGIIIACGALVVVGCIAELSSFHLLGQDSTTKQEVSASVPVPIRGMQEEKMAPTSTTEARLGREASTDVASVGTVINPAQESTQPKVLTPTSAGARQDNRSNISAKKLRKLVQVPETRPTTIQGWTLRYVVDGTATLEGPGGGIWKAARGQTIPGLGTVDSIVMWGDRWIVSTSRGLITTQ
jgi:hypothetical protein